LNIIALRSSDGTAEKVFDIELIYNNYISAVADATTARAREPFRCHRRTGLYHWSLRTNFWPTKKSAGIAGTVRQLK
jgi:hypothetical protein